ncbi:MAG: tryptophan-rich sensory protein [Patescibacteria group bacterium]|nr:tryptophan-rich sensory protein [Patescibacteria group bacterium]MDE1965683.1 tryptophan-rich sensory protein [Patescibacteria group bacterium]
MDTDTKLANYFIVYVTTLLFFGVGAITTLGLPWYGTLVLPAFMPATPLVAVIWCALFILAAWSACLFWDKKPHDARFEATSALFMGNALLVLFWNYAFFGLHQLVLAFWVSVFIALSVAALIARLRSLLRTAAWLLAPYLAWVAFAAYLTYAIWTLNP